MLKTLVALVTASVLLSGCAVYPAPYRYHGGYHDHYYGREHYRGGVVVVP